MSLKQQITRETLNQLAGAKIFQRGEEYFGTGAVSLRQVSEQKISAHVEGTENYQVALWDDNGLAYDCNCPHALEGYFCKHGVATGLAWLAGQGIDAETPQKLKKDPYTCIRDYLSTQTPAQLIALLLQAAERDERCYKSLLHKAEMAFGRTDIYKTLHKLITQTTYVGGFIDWSEVDDFVADLEVLIDSLRELLTPEHGMMLAELLEYAIERLERAIRHVDDSNGSVGGVIYTLVAMHLEACTLAPPEPVALAERLFQLTTASWVEACGFNLLDYQNLLGYSGLQRFRELAEAEWAKVPLKHEERVSDFSDYRITRVMETLAEISGNVEELVAIKARDLSYAYSYLKIAEIWAEAGQDEQALVWAEKGLTAFPEKTDNRLRDFLVDAYLLRKRSDEALQLTWIQFAERCSLEAYKKLYRVADTLGIWPAQRERALTHLAEVIVQRTKITYAWQKQVPEPDYSLRVEIALWEQDLDAAWTAVNTGACAKHWVIALAEQLALSRAADAVTLYQRVIPSIVEQTNNNAYSEAVGLIRKVAKLMHMQAEQQTFSLYVLELRTRYKAKRNFIKLLDGLAVE